MPLDTSKVNQKIPVPTGQILFEEGTPCNSLNIIHEGGYALEKKIAGKNVTLLQVTGKNLTPGIISLFSNGRYPYTIKTTADSTISTYQVSVSTIKKTVMSKMSIGVMIARTLLREIIETTKKANSIQSLASEITKTRDNLSLTYFNLEKGLFKDIDLSNYVYSEDEQISDRITRLTRKNLSSFIESGAILPEKPNLNFLDESHGEQLKTTYPEEIEFDDKEFLFMRKILSTDPNIQTPLFEADITILIQICEKFSGVVGMLIEEIEEISSELESSFELLLGHDSILEKYNMILELLESGAADEKPEVILPITEFASEKFSKFLLGYRNTFLREYLGVSKDLNQFISKSKSLAQNVSPESSYGSSNEESSITTGIDMDSMKKELDGSPQKIMNYLKVPVDTIKEYSALIAKLKSMKNPFDQEGDGRKVRKSLTKLFWDTYELATKKYIESNKQVPKQVEMMLNFTYFDDSLLEPNQQAFLYTYKDETQSSRNIATYICTDWLEQIYHRRVTTSLDELGQTYFDKIKNDHKDIVFKKESDVPANIDTNDNRLKYEISSMYQPNVRLTTGNPQTYLPILTKYQISLPLEKSIITREAIANAIKEIMDIDYTCFNREVMFNNEEIGIRKEFVQRSIIPDFIFVPSIGSKIMMWQDLSVLRGAGAKESKGRIIVPIFSIGDLKTMLLEAIAAFRWELTKNILGPEWNNVGNPSITSEYMDYIQFFKKNKDLSIEVKEKIATEFKRFRTDRDKFVNDYLLWIKYESEGIQRLNRVVRTIFYKHIPFHKEIRDKVSKLPAYADMHNRFTNIRNRQYRETEARYKKYQGSDGGYPSVLQENLDFYKV
ncbi:MAG: cyclic nucleotide-binding domain-containing protein [Leptospiraceae bacterium]|nr:cyclic nucleotide-binding domain-containing protein [Leptospiraceae bacterium]